MLEDDFEHISKRTPAGYGTAYLKYYRSMIHGGAVLSPDKEFSQSFDLAVNFVPVCNPDNRDAVMIGEETQFNSLADLLYTDFYLGLIHGNIPRRCHNCGKYFLLTAGYNTCYCNNIAPGETERTCRKVGAPRKKAREKASATPAKKEYTKTYNHLKARKQRGKISIDEWNEGVAKAQAMIDQYDRGALTDEELKEQLAAL